MKTVSGYLQGTVQSAQTLLDRNRQTNGPEGTVASKTVKSVHMINKGLARLQSNITKINPELSLNPEAFLTVKVENLHAVSHFKGVSKTQTSKTQTPDPRPRKHRPRKPRPRKHRPRKPRPRKHRPRKPRPRKHRPRKPRPRKHRPRKRRLRKHRPTKNH